MDAQKLKWWGAIVVSATCGVVFLALVAAVYFVQDADLRKNLLIALVQAGILNFTTVVGFWVGSSAGSQQKSDQAAPPLPPHP